ncbi:hypothetical protein FF38_07637 [Lucilia cuprina]|uniref:Uncharacterized protein n=1 Tax=Lucilia cuprina TaxID=7375 RepID=A0A0L0CGF5_LUCCU|nr:hypothetical protein FF38_07637 [Lucilia cuprina]
MFKISSFTPLSKWYTSNSPICEAIQISPNSRTTSPYSDSSALFTFTTSDFTSGFEDFNENFAPSALIEMSTESYLTQLMSLPVSTIADISNPSIVTTLNILLECDKTSSHDLGLLGDDNVCILLPAFFSFVSPPVLSPFLQLKDLWPISLHLKHFGCFTVHSFKRWPFPPQL